MATIVNSRDVLLQATSPRVEAVTLPPNVTVPAEQIPEIEDIYVATRQLELRASSQLFQVPSIGAITPSSLVIVAVLRNITGNVTFTVVDGSVNYINNGTSITVFAGGLLTNTATIQASVVFNSTTYMDQITIAKVIEGSDAIVGLLTNEAAVVPATSGGTVSSYDGAGGEFKIYRGLSEISPDAITFSTVSSTNVTVSVGVDGVYTVSNLTADYGYATLRASFDGVDIDKVYSIAKSRAGADGTSGSRGTVNIGRAIDGSVWLDSEAETAIASSGYGVPQARDIVTLYNLTSGFSETKYYTGTEWLSLDAYVNGNMLITGTVTANALAADSVTAEKVDVTNLAAISANLGTITAGSLNINDRFIVASDGSTVIKSGSSGQRTEIGNSNVRVYDSAGTLRVRLGIW